METKTEIIVMAKFGEEAEPIDVTDYLTEDQLATIEVLITSNPEALRKLILSIRRCNKMGWLMADQIALLLDEEMGRKTEPEDMQAFEKCQKEIMDAMTDYEDWHKEFYE